MTGFACGSEKAKPSDHTEDAGLVEDSGIIEPDAGPAGECNGQQMPEWAITCDCAEEGWLNCRANSDCSAEGIAACEAQGLQCRTDGDCYDARCEGVDCDPGKTCKAGDCVFDACLNKTCPEPKVCNEQGNCISETGANILYELEGGNDIVDDNGETKATVNIRLDSAPTADVRVLASLTGAGRDDVSVEGGEMSLTFTPENWETPQPLVIVGKGDGVVDGDKKFNLALTSMSDDGDFNNLSQSVSLVNRDTETASIILSLPELLETSENGDQVEIGVKLGGKPSGKVTIPLSVSNGDYAEVSPASLVILPADWNTEHIVIVTGKDDSGTVNTEPHNYQLLFGTSETTDALFAAMEMPTVDLVNIDNDVPQILVNKNPFTVSEGGGTDNIGISLSTQPIVETTITAQVTPAERCRIISESSLTFTADTYNEIQKIVVEGIDDDGTADGAHDCTLVLTGRSSDTNTQTTYNAINKIISGTVADNDVVGLLQRAQVSNLAEAGLDTDGYSSVYSASGKICYSLSSRPRQSVKLNISSSNTSTGATVSPSSLTFQPASYNTEQCVTVTAVDDGVVDSTNNVQIRAESTSSDNDYSGRFVSHNVNVYNRNNYVMRYDKMGYSTVRETGTVPFKFKLGSKPSSNVTVTLTSNSPDQIAVNSSSQVVIKPADWDSWQTARVEGVRDNAFDGNQYSCIRLVMSSSDSYYSGKSLTLCWTVEDIDSPGISLNCQESNTQYANCEYSDFVSGGDTVGLSAESLSQGVLTCSVSLTKAPSQNVRVYLQPVQSNGGSYGFSLTQGGTSYVLPTVYTNAPESASVLFTTSNYSTPQSIKFYYTSVPPGWTYNYKPYKAYDKFTVTAWTNSSSYPAPNVTSKSFSKYNICRYFYFKYKGSVRTIDLPAGTYRLRAWGASGGQPTEKSMALTSDGSGFKCRNHGGAGAYMEGTLTLANRESLYVRTGKAGASAGSDHDNSDYAYNGGGAGRSGGDDRRGGGGGGGTDFCIGNSACSVDANHWPYRILVAGGGGGGPDPTHSCYSKDDSYGASALKQTSVTYSETADGGRHKGSTTFSSNGASIYYAQNGSSAGTYTGRTDVGDRFGHGMSIFECKTGNGYSRAAGGGGWYGGLAYCGNTDEVGAGAGSSYAFTGTRHGKGQQSTSFALTGTNGADGGNGSVPYEEIGSDGKAHWGYRFGNVGNGYAVIEVQAK